MIMRVLGALLFLMMITMGNHAAAQEIIISPKDASKIKTADITEINLEMTLEDIAYAMAEADYKSLCSRNGCQFTKYGGAENVSIGLPVGASRKSHPEFILYDTKNNLAVCKDALSKMCILGMENEPCRTIGDMTILRVKSVEPDDDGWRYRLNVLLNTTERRCEIRASQSQKK